MILHYYIAIKILISTIARKGGILSIFSQWKIERVWSTSSKYFKPYFYLNPTAACHTKAKSKKNTGITGATSTIGLKIAYASGSLANNKIPSIFW